MRREAHMRYKDGVEVISPESQEELEALLCEMYPDNRIPIADIYNAIGSKSSDYSVFVHDHGHRTFFTPKELASYFWKRSNYYALETDVDTYW